MCFYVCPFYRTFNKDFQLVDRTPIPNVTVCTLDPETGEAKNSWGSNMFYVPHGLTVDLAGNTYVTDVGLHQVMRVGISDINTLYFMYKVERHNCFPILCIEPSCNAVSLNVHSSLQMRINLTWSWEKRSCRAATRSTFANQHRSRSRKRPARFSLRTATATAEYSSSTRTGNY